MRRYETNNGRDLRKFGAVDFMVGVKSLLANLVDFVDAREADHR